MELEFKKSFTYDLDPERAARLLAIDGFYDIIQAIKKDVAQTRAENDWHHNPCISVESWTDMTDIIEREPLLYYRNTCFGIWINFSYDRKELLEHNRLDLLVSHCEFTLRVNKVNFRLNNDPEDFDWWLYYTMNSTIVETLLEQEMVKFLKAACNVDDVTIKPEDQ